MLKKIQEDNITDIISTHAFPAIAVSNLKERNKINIPLYSLITDYTVHVAHVAKEIDKYIVGHEDVGVLLEEMGISRENIYPYGIPIDIKDCDSDDIDKWKKSQDVDDKFTLLIMGGSFGAGDIKSVYKELENIKEDLNIIIICGRNEHLKEKLENRIYRKNPKNKAIIVGFTQEIEKYYQIADIIITKPGGLTVTECIHKNLPMIIPFFIPGQEEGTKDFLLNNQMALYTSKYIKLSTVVKTVMQNPQKLELMKMSMKRNKKQDSARKIAELFL
ncbi:MAG: MGDG synthase family glycosyltransferase [Peptoanaerobacter stomatis]|uniref:MGDG synthase family glycosyltransferase n=1 Tax=Peptoanaerobacter stomatis TaxID=796937 RepID=UPI003F9EBB92